MELREYMSVRRAYNLVRQDTDSERRLTFEEFAILCRLDNSEEPVKTSDIADYQGALRPIMTHRTNHLASLGLIDRGEGTVDRRNIVCSISEEGRSYAQELSVQTRAFIATGQPLARTSPERLRRYVDTMGSVYCTAGELVLLALSMDPEHPCAITQLVERLGLLQPTVSMSVGTLVERGLVDRSRDNAASARSALIRLTDEGRERAEDISTRIAEIIVRRRPRTETAK